jgi:predicted amidohydrolase
MDRARAAGADLIAFAELSFLRFFLRASARRIRSRVPSPSPGPPPRGSSAGAERGLVTIINLYEADGERRFDASPSSTPTARCWA